MLRWTLREREILKEIKAIIGINKFYNQPKKNDFRLEVFGGSETGHRRTTNEDAFLIGDVNSSNKLLAVADAFNLNDAR